MTSWIIRNVVSRKPEVLIPFYKVFVIPPLEQTQCRSRDQPQDTETGVLSWKLRTAKELREWPTRLSSQVTASQISNGNRTEWSPIRSVIIRVINKIGRPRSGSPICLITSMIADRIGRHEVLLLINHNYYKICEISGFFKN